MRIKDIIAHLFDYHVMAKGNWTLEQLVAWVETVEPQDTVRNDNERENGLDEIFYSFETGAQPEIEDSQQEIEQWQSVRRAFQAKSDAGRKRDRLRP